MNVCPAELTESMYWLQASDFRLRGESLTESFC